MAAYYNEFDPYAAQWLRNLIAENLIAAGDVDERDIKDIKPYDLKGYTQCHFFAGIGGWSCALRLAMWSDDRPVWTGSCPCQPFSSAGQNKGQSDERHLWPEWYRLIKECNPAIVFGEQVGRALAFGWADEVKHNLESEDYAFGAALLPACAVKAPHERERFWFVAYAESLNDRRNAREFHQANGGQKRNMLSKSGSPSEISSIVAHSQHGGLSVGRRIENSGKKLQDRNRIYPNVGQSQQEQETEIFPNPNPNRIAKQGVFFESDDAKKRKVKDKRPFGFQYRKGHWEIEPAVGRVANGIPARVGKLRALGNAIVPQIAAEFIVSCEEAIA